MMSKPDEDLREVVDVCVDYDDIPMQDLGAMRTRREEVKGEICRLAQEQGLSIVFHKYADARGLGGGPQILVDLPASLAQEVRGISHVKDIVAPHLPTCPR